MNINLYPLQQTYKAVELALIESDGEITPDIEKMLAEISDSVDHKLTAIASLTKNFNAQVEVFKQEEKRLKAQREAIENQLEKLEGIAKFLLPVGESWTNGVHSLKYKPSYAVEIVDESLVPDEFKRVIPETKEVDKKKATEKFKEQPMVDEVDDTTIPGLKYVKRNNLQVK